MYVHGQPQIYILIASYPLAFQFLVFAPLSRPPCTTKKTLLRSLRSATAQQQQQQPFVTATDGTSLCKRVRFCICVGGLCAAKGTHYDQEERLTILKNQPHSLVATKAVHNSTTAVHQQQYKGSHGPTARLCVSSHGVMRWEHSSRGSNNDNINMPNATVNTHRRNSNQVAIKSIMLLRPECMTGTPVFPLFDSRRPRDINSIHSRRSVLYKYVNYALFCMVFSAPQGVFSRVRLPGKKGSRRYPTTHVCLGRVSWQYVEPSASELAVFAQGLCSFSLARTGAWKTPRNVCILF